MKKGKLDYNISAISRDLDYSGDGSVNPRIHELLNLGLIEIVKKDTGEYLKTTRKGAEKLMPYTWPKYLIFVIMIIGITDIWRAVLQLSGIVIAPFSMIMTGLVLIAFAVALIYVQRILKRTILS